MASELEDQLVDIDGFIATATRDCKAASGASRIVLEAGLQSLERSRALLIEQICEERENAERERMRTSPWGQLIYQVADAMQYDYLTDDDLPGIVSQVMTAMASRGLRVIVEKVDE